MIKRPDTNAQRIKRHIKIASLQPLTASLEKYKSIAIGFNFSK